MPDQVQSYAGFSAIEPLEQQVRPAEGILGDQARVLLHLIPERLRYDARCSFDAIAPPAVCRIQWTARRSACEPQHILDLVFDRLQDSRFPHEEDREYLLVLEQPDPRRGGIRRGLLADQSAMRVQDDVHLLPGGNAPLLPLVRHDEVDQFVQVAGRGMELTSLREL